MTIYGAISAMLVDKRNVALVTSSNVYVFNYDLHPISMSQRDLSKKIYSEIVASNLEEDD